MVQRLNIMVAALCFAALSGCVEFQSFKMAVSNYGQKAADESVSVGRWKHCNAESIGAIKRYYNTQEKMESYNQFCNMVSEVNIEPPSLPDQEGAP